MHRTALLVLPLLLVACSPADDDGTAAPTGTASSPSPSAATTPPPPVVPDTPAPGCPQRVPASSGEPWVPAAPTTSTEGRLVPDADPVQALVCRYAPSGPDGADLAGRLSLTGGLDRIRLDLAPSIAAPGTPGPCPASGERVPHLMRLTYADGDLWLAAPQDPASCSGASNGEFTTGQYLGDRLATAYETGAWPSAGDESAG